MVAVITLNYNQNEYTLKCIDSIVQSNYENFKIILIENGSTEENYQKLNNVLKDNHLVELHRLNINKGYVGGINYGLEKANVLNPKFILIMNNDTILDKCAVTELVNTCRNFNYKAIVSGKVYHYDEPKKLQDIGCVYLNEKTLKLNRIGLNEVDIGQYDKVSKRDLLDDVFWLFPSNLYKEIGGYSTYFWFSAEQADFAMRAKKKGYSLIYTPKAKLWHKGSISFGGRNRNPKIAYWHVQSTLIFRYLHLSRIEFFKQYIKMIFSISASFINVLRKKYTNNKTDFQYPKAKLKGLLYFNKWVFLKNENKGNNPFD